MYCTCHQAHVGPTLPLPAIMRAWWWGWVPSVLHGGSVHKALCLLTTQFPHQDTSDAESRSTQRSLYVQMRPLSPVLGMRISIYILGDFRLWLCPMIQPYPFSAKQSMFWSRSVTVLSLLRTGTVMSVGTVTSVLPQSIAVRHVSKDVSYLGLFSGM